MTSAEGVGEAGAEVEQAGGFGWGGTEPGRIHGRGRGGR